jgi:hypothetical protein
VRLTPVSFNYSPNPKFASRVFAGGHCTHTTLQVTCDPRIIMCAAYVPGLFSDVYSKRSAMCSNRTISPDDPAVHEARKAILALRTFLDVFSPVYPAHLANGEGDKWSMLRGDVDKVRCGLESALPHASRLLGRKGGGLGVAEGGRKEREISTGYHGP